MCRQLWAGACQAYLCGQFRAASCAWRAPDWSRLRAANASLLLMVLFRMDNGHAQLLQACVQALPQAAEVNHCCIEHSRSFL